MAKNGEKMILDTSLEIQTLKGPLSQKYIKDLARLRITLFRDYPFLYDGSLDYEEKYLQPYTKSEQFLIVLVFDGKKIVGASTAMPLAEESSEVKDPFIMRRLDISKFCYFGESILEMDYRGKGIGRMFFEEREAHAQSLGLTSFCFCTIVRPENHPKKLPNYYSLEKFWKSLGYRKIEGMVTQFAYKEIGEAKESGKQMQFWIKQT